MTWKVVTKKKKKIEKEKFVLFFVLRIIVGMRILITKLTNYTTRVSSV